MVVACSLLLGLVVLVESLASWYARVGGVIRREGMSEADVRDLAQYCKDNLRQPTSFDFMICQQHRIRTGEFNVVKRAPDVVPEMPLLPED